MFDKNVCNKPYCWTLRTGTRFRNYANWSPTGGSTVVLGQTIVIMYQSCSNDSTPDLAKDKSVESH